MRKRNRGASWSESRGHTTSQTPAVSAARFPSASDFEQPSERCDTSTEAVEPPLWAVEERQEGAPQFDEEAEVRLERGVRSDPERIYFAQMGAIRCLTREEEIRIAVEMEHARLRMQELLFATRLGQVKVVELVADSHARHVLRKRVPDSTANQEGDEEGMRKSFSAACASVAVLVGKNDHDQEMMRRSPEDFDERAAAVRRLDRRLQATARRIGKLGISPMHILVWTDELMKVVATLRKACGESPSVEQDPRFRAASYESFAGFIARVDALGLQRDRYCAARDVLSKGNLRLVVSIARRYRNSGIPLLDLIQEGNVGLLRACDGFEYRKGCRFSTYASHWIRQSIGCAVAEKSGMIRFPRHIAGVFARIRTHLRDRFARDGAAPDMESVAKETDSSEEHVRRFVMLSRGPLSLDSRFDDESDSMAEITTSSHSLPTDRTLRLATIQERIEHLLGHLPSIDREIMKLRYGIGVAESWSLRALAGKFDLSPESIRQIEGRTLRKLQRLPVASRLDELLE